MRLLAEPIDTPAVSPHIPRSKTMGTVTVGHENSTAIDIYYEDHGNGRPVVLSHGWPLSGAAWEKQLPALLGAGYRVITYDRRGFGKSSQPTVGYDYGTFADDLHKLITTLDLHDVTLVGHSMGSGEVAGYIGKYGTTRVRKAVFVSALPFFLKSGDNPNGVDPSVPANVAKALVADRPAFLSQFLADFYNTDVLLGKRVSPQVVQGSWNTAYGASAFGTVACVSAWGTDFRAQVARVNVPTLIIHGDADRILPYATTAVPLSHAIKGSRLVTIADGPHGIPWTHGAEVNDALLSFLAAHA
jgi:non-heme chloroperoxidase